MRKTITQPGLIITGAAALFVGLAGNIYAIPIPFHMKPDVVSSTAKAAEKTPAINPAIVNGNPVSLAVFPLSSSDPIQGLRSPVGTIGKLPNFHPIQYVPVTVVVTFVKTPTNNVPDGGLTALMLGGTFSGLVYLKRKTKA
jgi:hypothetical protein